MTLNDRATAQTGVDNRFGAPAIRLPMASVDDNVIPNDAAQQLEYLPDLDPEALFSDPELQDSLEGYAAQLAQDELDKKLREQHARDVAAAGQQAVDRLTAESKMKNGPGRAETIRVRRQAEQAVPPPDRESMIHETILEEFANLKKLFVVQAIRWIDDYGNKIIRRLRAELKTQEKQLATAEGARSVRKLREQFSERLQRVVDAVREGFKKQVHEYTLFRRAGKESMPGGTSHMPPFYREPFVKARDTKGVIQPSDALVAQSVVKWAAALESAFGGRKDALTVSSYGPLPAQPGQPKPKSKPHQWGPYSLDVTLDHVGRDERGFYPEKAILRFFDAADQAAKETQMEWWAIYNDASVKDAVQARYGKGRIHFSPMHGPDPFVLHVHFNLTPLALLLPPEESQSLPEDWPDFYPLEPNMSPAPPPVGR